jgi:hypothetical protein
VGGQDGELSSVVRKRIGGKEDSAAQRSAGQDRTGQDGRGQGVARGSLSLTIWGPRGHERLQDPEAAGRRGHGRGGRRAWRRGGDVYANWDVLQRCWRIQEV